MGSNPPPSASCWRFRAFRDRGRAGRRSCTANVQPTDRDEAGRVGTNLELIARASLRPTALSRQAGIAPIGSAGGSATASSRFGTVGSAAPMVTSPESATNEYSPSHEDDGRAGARRQGSLPRADERPDRLASGVGLDPSALPGARRIGRVASADQQRHHDHILRQGPRGPHRGRNRGQGTARGPLREVRSPIDGDA